MSPLDHIREIDSTSRRPTTNHESSEYCTSPSATPSELSAHEGYEVATNVGHERQRDNGSGYHLNTPTTPASQALVPRLRNGHSTVLNSTNNRADGSHELLDHSLGAGTDLQQSAHRYAAYTVQTLPQVKPMTCACNWQTRCSLHRGDVYPSTEAGLSPSEPRLQCAQHETSRGASEYYSPIQRWQQETFREGPWDGIAAVPKMGYRDHNNVVESHGEGSWDSMEVNDDSLV